MSNELLGKPQVIKSIKAAHLSNASPNGMNMLMKTVHS